jgi:lysine 2,3-aminomutase
MEWTDQLVETLTSPDALRRRGFRVTAADIPFPMRITPHLLSLMDPDTARCPIGRQFVPSPDENTVLPAELVDAVQEDNCARGKALIHAYPDRAVILASLTCPAYCRFCYRKQKVGTKGALTSTDHTAALDTLRQHPEVHDVLVSGGDPLLLSDHELEALLKPLSRIASVRVIRLGTRTLTTLPQRITPELVDLLATYRVRYLNTQINHPAELSPATLDAADRLRRAGITLGNQAVLLKGINDSVDTLRRLFLDCYHAGIRPYYLFHCDLTPGAGRFRTTLANGIRLFRALQGWISGPAVPRYVFDCPGIRKVRVDSPACRELENGHYEFTNYKGNTWVYDEPGAIVQAT